MELGLTSAASYSSAGGKIELQLKSQGNNRGKKNPNKKSLIFTANVPLESW